MMEGSQEKQVAAYRPKGSLPYVTQKLATYVVEERSQQTNASSSNDYIVKNEKDDIILSQSHVIATLVNALRELNDKVEKLKRGYFAELDSRRDVTNI